MSRKRINNCPNTKPYGRMRIHILTVSTDSQLYFPVLLQSCFRNGAVSCKQSSPIIFHILGFGEKWGGYTWRSQKILEYLNRVDVAEYDLVCVVDGYDVICMRNLEDLIDEYRRLCGLSARIIVGHTHTWEWMDVLSRLWFGSVGKGITINAGTYMGPVSVVRDMIEGAWIGHSGAKDDQVLLTKYVSENPHMFYVDVRGEIFWTVSYTCCNILPIVKDRLEVMSLPPPFFLHATTETSLNEVIDYLGYEFEKVPYWKLVFNFFVKFTRHLSLSY